MRRLGRALCVLAAAASGCAPSVGKAWVQQNHRALRTADPSDTDFSDLQFLKEAIGDRRIVSLGESSHGVAEFNSVKVRLIKFLHREMGFDVIAFESGLFECFRGDERLAAQPAADTMRCIFGVWHTRETLPLFEYLKETRSSARPLIFAGFDVQRSGWRATYDRADHVRSAMAVFDPALADEAFAVDREWQEAADLPAYSVAHGDRVRPLYARYAAAVEAHADVIQRAFPVRPGLAAALGASLTSMPANLAVLRTPPGEPEGHNARDRGMADNVDVLLERLYPGRKIILWAHNIHVMHDQAASAHPQSMWAQVRTMGHWLHARHSADLYTIGLFMAGGKAAHNSRESYDVKAPHPDGLEAQFDSASPLAFVDLLNAPHVPGTAWMDQDIHAWDWGYRDLILIPRRQFDGLLVVREAHPPHYQ